MNIDRAISLIKTKIISLKYDLLNLIDPKPKMREGEYFRDYVYRISKRHALRYLDYFLHLVPEIDDDEIDREIMFENDEQKKEKLRATKRMMIVRFKFKMLKQEVVTYWENNGENIRS